MRTVCRHNRCIKLTLHPTIFEWKCFLFVFLVCAFCGYSDVAQDTQTVSVYFWTKNDIAACRRVFDNLFLFTLSPCATSCRRCFRFVCMCHSLERTQHYVIASIPRNRVEQQEASKHGEQSIISPYVLASLELNRGSSDNKKNIPRTSTTMNIFRPLFSHPECFDRVGQMSRKHDICVQRIYAHCGRNETKKFQRFPGMTCWLLRRWLIGLFSGFS